MTAGPQGFTVQVAGSPEQIAQAGRVVSDAYAADDLADDAYRALLRDAAVRARDATLLVALEDDGRVLGSVTYSRAGEPLAQIATPGEAEFRMLGVIPAARGRGIGQALVAACIEQAERDGASALVLCTATAMRAAHRMYERIGFERAPDLDWSPTEQIDLLAYRLRLRPPGPGDAARP